MRSLNVKLASLLWLVILLPAQAGDPSFHQDKFHGRNALVLENELLRVSLLRGGGHVAEVRFVTGGPARTTNPMRVPHYQTIEPYEFEEAKHAPIYQGGIAGRVLGGYMGQLLCLPEFGELKEASIVEWKVTDVKIGADAVTLRYEAELPRSMFRVGRIVTLPAKSSVVFVEEWAENLVGSGRPMHWVEHVTLGPPFTEPGKTFLDMAPARWAGGRRGVGLTETPVRWPQGVASDGSPLDLRPFQPNPHASRYDAYLLDHGRPYSYFTMYHSELPVLIGYVFPAAENPWLVDWQENLSVQGKPWDGKVIARGIEFGTTPFDEGIRRSVERGRYLGTLPFRWINGQQRLTTRYIFFLADIPAGFKGVADVQLRDRAVVVQPAGSGAAISLPTGGVPIEGFK